MRLSVLLPVIWLGLRLLGFNRMRRFAEVDLPIAPAGETGSTMDYAQRCARLTAIAARHGLYRANCLHQSLALVRILRQQGLPARLVMGVLPKARPFQAHAWVELDDTPLGPSVSEYRAFPAPTVSGAPPNCG